MLPNERIKRILQELPAAYQAEVLDFVEYLKTKAAKAAFREECREWSLFSLSSALQDNEDEESPVYSYSDIKVSFT